MKNMGSVESKSISNAGDQEQFMDVDQAWEKNRFDIVLSLLLEDSNFPKNFRTDVLENNNSNEDARKLIDLYEIRRRIHQLIIEDDLVGLKSLISGNESKFYLNCKNESAVFTAVKNKKFKIYAFLRSIRADFKDENEKNVFKSLTALDKTTIQNYLVSYFKRDPDAHILYLLSKSSSLRLRNDFQEKVKAFYKELDRIPEIYQIFQVIQQADFLELVFDFDNDDISHICPTDSANKKGLTNYKEGRLYIAAGKNRTDREILGTIAHELTHMAMELIYENECNPYYEHDESRKMNYEKIVAKELSRSNSNKSVKITKEVEIASKIISDTFSLYTKYDHHNELIVRVPQILAQLENGRQLILRDHADLYNYFNEIITKDFKNFAAQRDNLKVKRQIRSTNESLGEIKKVREYPLRFKDVSKIQQVLTGKTKNVFVVVGDSSWLCVIKTLQGIYGSDYVNYDRYLVFKIQNFLTQPEQILKNFTAGGIDLLVIECPNDDNENIDNEKIALIHDLLMCNENKKIVFAVHCDFESKIKSILRQCDSKYDYFNDSFLSLCDLHIDSQNKILKEELLFQKKRTSIIDLIKQDDKIKGLIDAKIVDELIGNQRIKIGSEGHGLASLDGAYANLQEEIDTKVLADVLSDSKRKFFVFEGFKSTEDLLSAMKKLSHSKNEILQKTLLSLEKDKCIKTENSYSDEKFKNLCKNNARKDVYWIQFQAGKNGLFLRKLYTPNFYLKRNFVVYNKIVVQIQEIAKCKDNNTILISNTNEEQFKRTLAKIAQRNEQQNDEVRNKNRSKTSKPHNLHNIIFAETETKAQNTYDNHIRYRDSPIYWLKMEGDEFVYVRSCGNLSNFRKNIDIENTKKYSISETDVIENLEHNNPIIIADDPGMGKSTTIIKLSENRKFSSKYWMVKVNLKEFSTWMTNTDFSLTDGILIEYLSQFISESGKNMARLLLKSAIHDDFNFPIPIFIFFDGFDEISEETDKNKIISLLQFLKNKTKVKFLITTRHHCKNILEDSLGQLAWEFEPMDDATKKTFIESYIKIRLNLTLEKKLLEEGPISFYTTKFLEKMASIFKVDLARFIGTPLQLYLLLEDTLKHFKDWAKQQSKNFKDPDFSFFGNNLLQIYSNFLDKKYDYFKQMKKKSNEYSFEDIKLTCEDSHIKLAEILTINLTKNPTVTITQLVLDCGIVNYQDGNYKFIHPTFREYYAAKLFMKWIEKPDFSNEKKLNFIFRSVLLKPDYQIVRCFLNDMFWKIKSRKIAQGNFEYFKNVLESFKNHKMVASSLDVLIQEEHANIFYFFISLMTRETFLSITCRFNDPPLIYACRCNRKEIVECILIKYDQKLIKNQNEYFETLCKRGRSNETCLHHAAFYNNADIVKLILDKAREKCSVEQFYAFLEIKDDNGNTPLHLSASCLGQHFADINQEFMKTYFRNPLLSPFYAKYQWQYKYWFPEMPYELLAKNIYQVLFHHYLAAEERGILLSFNQYISNIIDRFLPNATNVFELILKRLPTEKAESMICATDASGCNSLHYAVANQDVNLIQKISNKISPTLLSALINTTISNEMQGDSAIDITFNRDDVSTFQFLLGLIPSKYIYETLSATKNDGFNILHNSVRFGKEHFLRVILNNLEKATCSERENILLLKTADPKMDYNTLHLSAVYNQPSVAQLLLQYAKDTSEAFLFNYLVSVTKSNFDALNIAVSKKNIEMAQLLLNAIPTKRLYEAFMPDNGKDNALHTAALYGDSETTKLILQKLESKLPKKDILTILTSFTRTGQTAMQSAILKNHVSVVAVLLEYSIKNSFEWEYLTRNNSKCNVIHTAIRKNYSETVKLIVDKIEGKKLNQILNISSVGSIDTFLKSVQTEKNNELLEIIHQKFDQSDISRTRSSSGNNKQESRKPKVAMYRK